MNVKRIVSEHLQSNTFVVTENGKSLVVDCGATVQEVKDALGGGKVVGVLLTHGHFDHAFNCLDYAREFGCKIYASENVKEILPDPAKNYGEDFTINDFSDFEFISGDGELCVGGFGIKYFAIPGHSACQVGFLVERELFVGDCIFYGGIGRMDLITSSKSEMPNSLRKLEPLEYDSCHSGHGRDASQSRMRDNLQIYIKYLTR